MIAGISLSCQIHITSYTSHVLEIKNCNLWSVSVWFSMNPKSVQTGILCVAIVTENLQLIQVKCLISCWNLKIQTKQITHQCGTVLIKTDHNVSPYKYMPCLSYYLLPFHRSLAYNLNFIII